MTKPKPSKLLGLTDTLAYKALKTLDLFRGSLTLSSLASIGFFIWAMYVIFSQTPADRYRFFDIRFNYEEEVACENELLKNCRPDITQRIQSTPHSLFNEPLKKDEHRLLKWHENKSYYSKTQAIMDNYIWKYSADRNDGYVLKFCIPQHGPRKGKVSAPAEIEPYIQSAINRCIDNHDYEYFSGGGVIGKLEKGTCIYENFYLAPSKWNQYREIGSDFLKAVMFLVLFFVLLLIFLLIAIPSIFITLAILESILMLVIFSFKPRHQQSNEPVQ